MDLPSQQQSLNSSLSVTLLINYLAATYFSSYYCYCIFQNTSDGIVPDIDTPRIVISVSEENSSFETTFRNSVNNGCQAFIVYGQALWPFLNSFIPTHDASDYRYPRKKLIAVMDSSFINDFDKLCRHSAVKEIPNFLIILWNQTTTDVQLYTTEIFNDGKRGSTIVSIRPIFSPDYFPRKDTNLNGIPVRLRTLDYLPFSYYEETTAEKSNARYDPEFEASDVPLLIDGQEPLMMVEFCRKYNCSIVAFFDQDALWGEVFDNNTGTGMLGAVAERKADFAVAAIYHWLEPYRYCSYTAYLSRSGITVLVPKPQLLPSWQIPFLSFGGYLWAAVAASFCSGVFAVWLTDQIRTRMNGSPSRQAKSFSDSLLILIGFFMEQSAPMENDSASCVFLFSSLIFAGFMISNMYGAALASTMTIPQYERPIDTTRDLAESGMLWAATAINWILTIMTAPQPYLQTLVSNYRILETEILIKHRTTHDLGYAGERTEFDHFAPVDFLDTRSSHMLQLLKDDLFWQMCTAVITKTCPFTERLNSLIMLITQSGIPRYWELRSANRYMDTTIQRNIIYGRQKNNEGEAEVLTVSHFMGAFLILGLGFLFALTFFILEIFLARKKQKNSSPTANTTTND